MRTRRSSAQRLRRSIGQMPRTTREAMLRGIESNEIIVGAYVDNASGGICPMLAAHRNGGRTTFGAFALAWDEYTGAGRKPRPATRRELRTLRGYLEASLASDELPDTSLAEEVRSVQASRRRLAALEAREASGVTVEEILTSALLDEQLQERIQLERGAADALAGTSEDDLRHRAVAGSRE